MSRLVKYIFAAALLLTVHASFAQIVKKDSPSGHRLPKDYRIDGRLSEWKDSMQATNRQSHLDYTLANDDQNLYLAIRTRDEITMSKIMEGGIRFTIDHSNKKKAEHAPAITYPGQKSVIYQNKGARVTITGGTSKLDSATIVKRIIQEKDIIIENFPTITEPSISIYNEYGIKTALRLEGGAFTYELLIPFDKISVKMDAFTSFGFNIRLNGVKIPVNGQQGGSVVPLPPPGAPPGRAPSVYSELTSPTDFWGTYTLSK